MGAGTKETRIDLAEQTDFDSSLSGTPSSTTRTPSVDNQDKIRELNTQLLSKGASAQDVVETARLHGEIKRLQKEQDDSIKTTTRAGTKGDVQKQYDIFKGLIDAGPGQSDVTAGADSVRSLADMLKQYSQTGGLPGQEDISQANSFARSLFGTQQEQLNQSFGDQYTEANRRSALMGRSMNDPILAAKLGIEQTRQQRTLDSQRGGWAMDFALQQPDRKLGYAMNRTNALQGLASQAMANRQALLSMGSGIQANERNWRLNTGTQVQTSTPGLADWIGLGLQAVSTGVQAVTGFSGGPAAKGAGGGASSWNPAKGASNAYTDSQMASYMSNRFGGK